MSSQEVAGTLTLQVSPPNSLIVVSGLEATEVPEPDGVTPVVASADTLLILTRYQYEGPTRLTVNATGVEAWPPDGLTTVFDGNLLVRGGVVLVQNVYTETYASIAVPSEAVRVRIGMDRPNEPRKIFVQIG